MEERAGERRRLCPYSVELPLSSVLSPLLRHGERKEKICSRRDDFDRY